MYLGKFIIKYNPSLNIFYFYIIGRIYANGFSSCYESDYR